MTVKYAVTIETKLRTAAQIAAYVATGITQFGCTSKTAQYIVLGCSVVITAYNFWKNNSFTQAAIQADVVMKALKDVGEDTVNEFNSIKESDS